MIKNPSSLEELKLNADNGFVTQLRLKSKTGREMRMFHFSTPKHYSQPINKLQFRKKDESYFFILFDGYGQKTELPFSSDDELLLDMLINPHETLKKKNGTISHDSVSLAVFKIKDFDKTKIYANDLKPILFSYLVKKFPTGSIIDEFTIGKTIVDMAVFSENKIHFFEIKSDQDSFTRLEKQLNDYLLFSNSTHVVLAEGKSAKYSEVFKDLFPSVGEILIKNNKLKVITKAKTNSKIEGSLEKLIWSEEIINLISNLPGKTALASRETILEYLYFILKSKTLLNKLFYTVLFNRYQDISDLYRNNPAELTKPRAKITTSHPTSLDQFCCDERVIITHTPKEYVAKIYTDSELVYHKYPFLINAFTTNSLAHPIKELPSKFDPKHVQKYGSLFSEFIRHLSDSVLHQYFSHPIQINAIIINLHKSNKLAQIVSDFEVSYLDKKDDSILLTQLFVDFPILNTLYKTAKEYQKMPRTINYYSPLYANSLLEEFCRELGVTEVNKTYLYLCERSITKSLISHRDNLPILLKKFLLKYPKIDY